MFTSRTSMFTTHNSHTTIRDARRSGLASQMHMKRFSKQHPDERSLQLIRHRSRTLSHLLVYRFPSVSTVAPLRYPSASTPSQLCVPDRVLYKIDPSIARSRDSPAHTRNAWRFAAMRRPSAWALCVRICALQQQQQQQERRRRQRRLAHRASSDPRMNGGVSSRSAVLSPPPVDCGTRRRVPPFSRMRSVERTRAIRAMIAKPVTRCSRSIRDCTHRRDQSLRCAIRVHATVYGDDVRTCQ
jgi:hypothetical protein